VEKYANFSSTRGGTKPSSKSGNGRTGERKKGEIGVNLITSAYIKVKSWRGSGIVAKEVKGECAAKTKFRGSLGGGSCPLRPQGPVEKLGIGSLT